MAQVYPKPLSAYNGNPSFKNKLSNLPPKSARNVESYAADLYKSGGVSFTIKNKDKDITAIVFKYGIIYTGHRDGIYLFSEKPAEWKIIWFEMLTAITATNNDMNIETSTKKYNFKPSTPESWALFRKEVYDKLASCPVTPDHLDIQTITSINRPAAGGRRKTKRSKKRMHRTRRH